MKKLLFLFLFVLGCVPLAHAQNPTPVVVTDANGKSLTVTGVSSATQVGSPIPVVITDSNGKVIALGSGAGITFVAVNPATCTPGTSGVVELNIAPYTVSYCSATNTWTAIGAGGAGLISNQAAKAISTNSGGTSTVIDSTACTPPATAGKYVVEYSPTTSAAVSPDCSQVGLAPRGVSGTTDTLLYSDNNGVEVYGSALAVALTGPTPTSLGNSNFFSNVFDHAAGAVTFTPTTFTVSLNGLTAAASVVIQPFQKCSLLLDPLTGSQWDLDCVDLGGSPGGPLQFNAKNYGVLADAQVNWAPSWTSGSNVVTCTTCNFQTTARVGQIVFGTNVNKVGYVNNITTVVQLPQTTIQSIDSNTQIHTVGNANANFSTNGALVWGDDDTTALLAAWTAASNACSMLVLPYGRMLDQKGQFITAPTTQCVLNTGSMRLGPGVSGQGMTATTIIPTPNFDPTTCIGPNTAGNVCFFAQGNDAGFGSGMYVHDLLIWGAGNSAIGAGFNGKYGVGFEANSIGVNFNIAAWGANTAGFTGLAAFQVPVNLFNVEDDGAGTVSCDVRTAQQNVYFEEVFCGNGDTRNLKIESGAILNSTNSYYGAMPPGAGSCAVEDFGTLYSVNDLIGGSQTSSGSFGLCVDGSPGTAYLDNDIVIGSGSSQYAVGVSNSGSKLYASKTVFTGASGALDLTNAAAGFFDLGGNTFTGTAGLTGSGFVAGQGASITGTLVTAAKLVLSGGWGTTAADTALSGFNAPIKFTVTNSGTGQGASPTITYTFPVPYLVAPLWCTATQVAGTNAVGLFTASSLTATGVVFTYGLTPTAAATEIITITCLNP